MVYDETEMYTQRLEHRRQLVPLVGGNRFMECPVEMESHTGRDNHRQREMRLLDESGNGLNGLCRVGIRTVVLAAVYVQPQCFLCGRVLLCAEDNLLPSIG